MYKWAIKKIIKKSYGSKANKLKIPSGERPAEKKSRKPYWHYDPLKWREKQNMQIVIGKQVKNI